MKCKFCGKKTEDNHRKGRTRCNSCNTKIRRVRNKIAAIQYLGGQCNDCGIKATWCNHSIFEFHHKNSFLKEFAIGKVANKSWLVIKTELNKCELLCSNCHQAKHSERDDYKFITEASKYNGNIKDLKMLLKDFFEKS